MWKVVFGAPVERVANVCSTCDGGAVPMYQGMEEAVSFWMEAHLKDTIVVPRSVTKFHCPSHQDGIWSLNASYATKFLCVLGKLYLLSGSQLFYLKMGIKTIISSRVL